MVTRHNQRGHALLLAVGLTVLAAMVAQIVHQLVMSRLTAVRREGESVTLVAMADACLAQTLAELAAAPGFPGVRAQRFAAGTIASVVKATGEGHAVVSVIAKLAHRALEVEAQLTIGETGARVESWRRLQERTATPGSPAKKRR